MRFCWEGREVELKGDPSLGVSQMLLKAMEKTLRK